MPSTVARVYVPRDIRSYTYTNYVVGNSVCSRRCPVRTIYKYLNYNLSQWLRLHSINYCRYGAKYTNELSLAYLIDK